MLGATCVRRAHVGSNYDDPAGPLLAGPSPAAAGARAGRGDTLRVASFNIRYAERVDAATAILRTQGLADAEILFLQEMDSSGVRAIARALRCGYVYVPAVIHRSTGRQFGNAILTRDPILSVRKVLLPHADPDGHRRVAAVARVAAEAGDTLDVVSVHLGTRITPMERADQVRAILEATGGDQPGTRPIVIGGDFNTFSREHERAVQRPFGASRFDEARGCGDWTYAVRVLDLPLVRFHFDRIFVRNGTVVACGRYAGRQDASDHWPIWADLVLR